MTVTETRDAAADWMRKIAADNTHGYDQTYRWNEKGDYDCSSLVISAYKQAGVPLTCTYTGNMRADMLRHGFKDVTSSVTLSTGAGLKKGDVLLNEVHHTAMYIGDKKIVHAAGNEWGGATGGKTGDQTGKEICEAKYFNFPWDCVLRFSKAQELPVTDGETYIVQHGDSLWGIAEKVYGDGTKYALIMSANNLADSFIYPGQELIIPAGSPQFRTISITITNDTYELLKIMADGWNKTIGQCIDKLMEDAL